jgi:hypothetical protein
MRRRVRTGRLIVKRTRVLQPSPGMEPTRGQSQEPQERPQPNKVTGTIHGSQDPDLGASVGQTRVRQHESRASTQGEGEPKECRELLHASPELQDFLLEFRCLQVRHVQAYHDLRCLAEPTHGPSNEGRRDSWRWSPPRCPGRDPEAGDRSAAEGGPWLSWGMIIGRSPTPLNSSRTLRAVGRRETVRGMTTRAGSCRMSVETARPNTTGRLCSRGGRTNRSVVHARRSVCSKKNRIPHNAIVAVARATFWSLARHRKYSAGPPRSVGRGSGDSRPRAGARPSCRPPAFLRRTPGVAYPPASVDVMASSRLSFPGAVVRPSRKGIVIRRPDRRCLDVEDGRFIYPPQADLVQI